HASAVCASRGRFYFWIARGPVRAPHAADDRHHLLLSHGVADRVFSELHLAADLSRALRNRHWARRWQWNPCLLPHVDCSLEFYNKVMRLVICWRPLSIGSYFRSSDGAASSWQERCPHFLFSTFVREYLSRQFGCNGSARRVIFGAI